MMRRFCAVSPAFCLSLVLFGAAQDAGAAFERQVTGGRSAGMGSAIVSGSPGVWSASMHSALLMLLDRPSIECQMQPSPFGLPELSRAGLVAALPLGPGTVALSGMRLGGDLYQEIECALSAGVRLHRILFLGLRVRWCHLSIARYGSGAALACDLSVAALPLDGFVLAATVEGLNRPAIGEGRERLPFAVVIGAAYRPTRAMEVVVEWEHDILYDPGLRAGIEYAPADAVCLRAGIAEAAKSWSCGIGLRYGGLLCDYGILLHPILGPAHTLSFGIGFE